jgi:predicted SnoaL-like aldol condensation-catalyzing enzyme
MSAATNLSLGSHITPKPGTPGVAVGDLFRLQGDRLLEHWDITDWLAPKRTGKGMFDKPATP